MYFDALMFNPVMIPLKKGSPRVIRHCYGTTKLIYTPFYSPRYGMMCYKEKYGFGKIYELGKLRSRVENRIRMNLNIQKKPINRWQKKSQENIFQAIVEAEATAYNSDEAFIFLFNNGHYKVIDPDGE